MKEIPAEVREVVILNRIGALVGLEKLRWIQEIMDKYPEYFEWEHIYSKIPQEVHNAFQVEAYPKEESNAIPYGEGLWTQLSKSPPSPVKKLTKEDLYEFFAQQREKDEAQVDNEKRVRKVWDKHYGKYNLIYRDPL